MMALDTQRIHIVGVGADGVTGLPVAMQQRIQSAPVVCGSDRILQLYAARQNQHIHRWASPFADNLPIVAGLCRTYNTVVVLATGDGNWFGPSRMFVDYFGADAIALHPYIGAFQLATSHLRWCMQDCHFTSVHGRDIHTVKLYFYHRAKVVVLACDKHTVQALAQMLYDMGLGASVVHTLNALGTPAQSVQTHTASDICTQGFVALSDVNTIAIACVGTTPSLAAGVADDLYSHDGQITKSPVRAITMAQLQPYPGAVLWDFGAGSGSISVEWCRLGGVAQAFERTKKGCDTIAQNAEKFGVADKITIHHTHIQGMPKDAITLTQPTAIFIGGGISGIDIPACIDILPVGGRLVANTVTLSGQRVILNAYETYGGNVQKISITGTARTARFTRWAPLIPVTQYTYIKGHVQ